MLMYSGISMAQDKTAELIIIRGNSSTGAALKFKVYVDDKLICRIGNRRFSSHQLSVGTHKITVEAGGIGLGNKNHGPLQMEVKEGQVNYVQLLISKGLFAKELSETSAKFLMNKCKPVSECLPAGEE